MSSSMKIKMKIAKKRLMMDGITMSMLILAGILIFLMHKYMGKIDPVYIPEAKVYGMPFYIGFRWSVILGMLGVLLIQVVMYIWSYCRKSEKMLIFSTGIWLDMVIMFEYVSDQSGNIWFFILRDDLKWSIALDFLPIWSDVNSFKVLVVFIIGIVYLVYWLFGVNMEDSDTAKMRKWFSFIGILIGTVLLVLETRSALWYFVACAFTSAISWIVLGKVGKVCEPYMDEEMSDTLLYRCIEPLVDRFIKDDDDEEHDEIKVLDEDIKEEIGKAQDDESGVRSSDKIICLKDAVKPK